MIDHEPYPVIRESDSLGHLLVCDKPFRICGDHRNLYKDLSEIGGSGTCIVSSHLGPLLFAQMDPEPCACLSLQVLP